MGVQVPNVNYYALNGNGTPVCYGGYYEPDVVKATRGVAGTPGSWNAAGSVPPSDAAEATHNQVAATPATAWTTGQYVQGRDPTTGKMHWTGTAWAQGTA